MNNPYQAHTFEWRAFERFQTFGIPVSTRIIEEFAIVHRDQTDYDDGKRGLNRLAIK
jgi:hypothetical protein